MGEGQTAEVDGASERVGFGLWVKALFATLAVFSWFIGELNLASIVSRYGFQWRPEIVALVVEYKSTIYPIYDAVFRFFAAWLHWHFSISATVKDVLTILGLCFVAANAESLIRDGRLLIINLFRTFGKPDQDASKSMFLALGRRWLPFAMFLGTCLYLVVLGFCLFEWRHQFWHWLLWLPWWARVWTGIGWLPAVALLMWLLGGLDPPFHRQLLRSPMATLFQAALLAAVAGPGLLIIPVIFVLFGTAWLAVPTAVLVVTLIFVLVSPVLAWRTVTLTLLLFLLMMGANWIVLHHIA